jgi:sugar O-acyltransferase (sialic acid O-acetyltransferase NeuD family)
LTRERILLVGAGGHARACIDVIEQESRFEIAGLVGLSREVGTSLLGYPVLGTDADLRSLRDSFTGAIVTVGQIKTAEPRMRLFKLLELTGCALPTVISPLAHVSRHAGLGAGTIVMHGAIVNAGAVVGRNCIVNSHALIEHDANIADHCHIATSVAVNSGVRIGAGTFIGSNSSIRQSIVIGEQCMIGMGQRIVTDCKAGTWIPSPKRAT